MASITNYPKVLSLASTDIVVINDYSSGRTKRTDIVQICKFARDYIQLGEDAGKVDYLQELMSMLTIVDGDLIMTSSDSYANDNGIATTSAVRSLITEATGTLASAQDITQLNASLTAYVNGSIVSFTTADAVSQLITKAGVGYSTAADLTTLQTTMEGYTNGQLTSYTNTTALNQLLATTTAEMASAEWVTTLETDLKTYADGVVTDYTTTEAVRGLIADSTPDSASTEDFTKLKSELGTFDEDGTLLTLSSSIAQQVLSTENTSQFAQAEYAESLEAQFTDEDGNTLISRIDENKQVISGVDGRAEATYTLEVDNGTGNIAGMKLGSNSEGSEIVFTADSFKISNGAEGESPFEVINGNVKIKSASIGSITFGDIADVPDTFTTTIIYADDASGANASTTKGTKNYIAFYNTLWVDGDDVSNIPFDKITGSDGTSVNILGAVDSESELPATGNSPGDGYLINGVLFVWNGTGWENVGNIQGPAGADGYNPVKGVDYFDGEPGGDGGDGDSAYSTWLAAGNTGTTTDFLNYLVGRDGRDGMDGIPGEPGEDGITVYTWIRYADNGDGSQGFSNAPADKFYIGFAFNKTTSVESEDASDYTWSLIKGSDGLPGATKYTWVKYADDENGAAMVDNSSEKAYIGMAFNKDTATESTNPADYTWSKIKGDDGVNGTGSWTPVITPPSSIKQYGNGGFTKLTSNGWNTSIHSAEGHNGGVYLSAKVNRTDSDLMVGLNSDPLTDETYQSIDYAFYARSGGLLEIYESATRIEPPVGLDTYTTDTVLSIEYDGNSIKYFKDGVAVRSIGRTSTAPLYLDTSIYTINSGINSLVFGKSGVDGKDGLPGEAANAGANGKKTASGTLFFQQGTQSAPSAPSSSSAVFLFVNGVFTGLPDGWGLSTPEMAAGTASNKYWTVSWSAIETAADSNEGAVTFGPVTRSFAFNQVVTFDSLETSGSTVINGDNITTGIIKDTTYLNTSGDGFSDFGMAVDLDNGSIHAEKFYINPDGNANFAGNHGSGTLGGWEINEERIFKDSDTGGISLSSARNALEIFDENNSLTVDINNKNNLSSVQGATTYPSSSVPSGTSHDFNTYRDLSVNTSLYGFYRHNPVDYKTYSPGQLNFSINANLGENVRARIYLPNLWLIRSETSYSGDQYSLDLTAKLGMEVYNSDTGNLIWGGFKSFELLGINNASGTGPHYLRTGITELSTMFRKQSSNNYHIRFFTKDHLVGFSGEHGTTVNLSGTFNESLGFPTQNATMVLDANKTEILAGGFQVVKSAAEFFRVDRNSQSVIESSGSFRHNGAYVLTSDKNQKYNIKPIDFDLDLLSNINGYNYSQIINPVHTLSKASAEDICTIESAGLIAQEIEAVLPNAVSTGEDGIKALNYSATAGLLMNIVKQLNEKITLLELEINNLKN